MPFGEFSNQIPGLTIDNPTSHKSPMAADVRQSPGASAGLATRHDTKRGAPELDQISDCSKAYPPSAGGRGPSLAPGGNRQVVQGILLDRIGENSRWPMPSFMGSNL